MNRVLLKVERVTLTPEAGSLSKDSWDAAYRWVICQQPQGDKFILAESVEKAKALVRETLMELMPTELNEQGLKPEHLEWSGVLYKFRDDVGWNLKPRNVRFSLAEE